MHVIAYIYISITTTITRVELSELTLSGEYTAQSTEPNRKIGHRNRKPANRAAGVRRLHK